MTLNLEFQLSLDTDILLWINGHHTAWLDSVMWWISHPRSWLPLYVLLIGLVAYRFRSWKAAILIIVGFIAAVGLSDWICSGVLKPWVCRLRPTHEPGIDPIHMVNDYMGGLYGFCSSHAANTIAVALLFSLLYRNKIATTALMIWVALNCYSRMYLGAHYPTDVLAGLAIGALFALLVYAALLRPALRRWHCEAGAAAPQGGS